MTAISAPDLTLYGTGGRTFRVLWMLHELGLPFQHEPVDWTTGEQHSAAYLAVNPNGKVPALVDGSLVLFESMAINLHLARAYGPALWPDANDPGAGTAFEARIAQWTLWGACELEGPHDAANRSGTSIDANALHRSLEALRAALSQSDYVLGPAFSVIDLNIACLLLRPQYRRTARKDAQLSTWFDACTRRPALARATAP